MEGQERVQDSQSPIGNTDRGLGLGDCTEDPPFVDGDVRRRRFRGRLAGHHAERERPPPEGRRSKCLTHVFLPCSGKENQLAEPALDS
jgi:hypothetical protein